MVTLPLMAFVSRITKIKRILNQKNAYKESTWGIDVRLLQELEEALLCISAALSLCLVDIS